MTVMVGQRAGKGHKIGLVVAQFNELVTEKLQAGAVSQLKKNMVLVKTISPW